MERKKDIARLVAKHGGQFLRNLERPVRVTHLLCSGDAETEKMRYAEKFNKSGEAHIFLVWEEWFWDAIDFHGELCGRLPPSPVLMPFIKAASTKPPTKYGILAPNESRIQKIVSN